MAIIRRDGKYGVRVYDRRAQGQRWVGTFDRLKDAKRAEADATDAQRPVATRTLTVARWVERWLNDYARPTPATRTATRSSFNGPGGGRSASRRYRVAPSRVSALSRIVAASSLVVSRTPASRNQRTLFSQPDLLKTK